jgi:hypothetical protein
MSEPAAGTLRPLDESALREEIKRVLDEARAAIRDYTGLYAQQNLSGEVLNICQSALRRVDPDARVDEARRLVAERCGQLSRVADRFAERDPISIAAARALALAALDTFQDVVFDLRKVAEQPRGFGSLLRKRAQSPSAPQTSGAEWPRART